MTLPVPSQRTWTVGDIVTAAEMNANVRDAVNFLASPPLFVGYQATGQSVASSGGVFTALTIDTEVVDSYNGHSNSLNPARYVAQVAGYHLVLGQIGFPGLTAGVAAVQVQINGAAPTALFENELTSNPTRNVLQVAAFQFLNVGDYAQVGALQNSGSAVTLVANLSLFAVIWCHA